jgi:hypothetical protein
MSEALSTDNILPLIQTIRGQRVILAADLAKLYGVRTLRLNEAVKRNKVRFPSDFMFQLTMDEWDEVKALRSQFAILKPGQHQKYRPYAFTEHGAIMAANVLSSAQAVAMSVYIVRAFVQQRDASPPMRRSSSASPKSIRRCCCTTRRFATFIKSSGHCCSRRPIRQSPRSVFVKRHRVMARAPYRRLN